MPFAWIDYNRYINIGLLVGLLAWQAMVISIMTGNWRRSKKRMDMAILLIFVFWAIENIWLILGIASHIGNERPGYSIFLSPAFGLILILAMVVITNFTIVLYHKNIKQLIRRWLDNE